MEDKGARSLKIEKEIDEYPPLAVIGDFPP
jgi:hypothetical protein